MRASRPRPWRARAPSLRCTRRLHDVVAISNLCVDVLVHVEELPGVHFQHVAVDASAVESDEFDAFETQTLVCYVLVDQQGNHRFCSAYDFGPWPLLGGRRDVPRRVRQALANTSAVYLNGFAFDELEASLLDEIMQEARRDGVDLFFDIGPRAFGLDERPAVWKDNLQRAVAQSDVLLLTHEEAIAFTLESDPKKAAESLLQGMHTKWVVLKDGPYGATLYTADGRILHQDAFHVDVVDTVGCGDSFASAIVMGYTGKHDVAATMKLANAVGAATATKQGAGRNVASFDAVRDESTP
eukprot:jgi/Pico_ML_1/51933/g2723.t2